MSSASVDNCTIFKLQSRGCVLSFVYADTDVVAYARLCGHCLTLTSHQTITEPETHIPLHPLDIGARSNVVRNTHGSAQPGKNTDPDYRPSVRERTHVAAECLCTFSSTTFAAVA